MIVLDVHQLKINQNMKNEPIIPKKPILVHFSRLQTHQVRNCVSVGILNLNFVLNLTKRKVKSISVIGPSCVLMTNL